MHKVIIADDEMRARSLIRMLVPWEELELELLAECEDGDALCAKTEELSPDIIITDMRMPGLNGAALIRNLHTVFPACQIIVVSGFDDFEYMRQALVSKAVDYILKPIEEDALRAALENAICERKRLADEHKRNRREVLNQLIHGAAPVTEADCARYLEASQYTVLLIHLFETRAAEPYAVRQLIDTIHAEAAHFLSADGVVFRDDQNSNSICVILFVPVASVMEALSKIVFSLCRDAGIEAVFTCGQPFSEKRRIKRSYHQARAVLETYNVRLASDVAYYDGDADAPEAERDRLTEGYNYVLDNARQSEDLVDYQRCMQMFVESVSRKKCIPLGTLQMFIVQLIKSMEPLALHQVSDVTMTGIMSLRTQMLLRLSPEDIRADLEEFLHQVCAFEGNQSKQNYTGRAQELRAYLDEHYRKKFTLDELASIFYLNKEYMSKLFRKEYGIRIGEYVDFLKIEDAKRLLLLGNMTVSEITELLNFYDESHFNKKFKKAVGVNPKDFRK